MFSQSWGLCNKRGKRNVSGIQSKSHCSTLIGSSTSRWLKPKSGLCNASRWAFLYPNNTYAQRGWCRVARPLVALMAQNTLLDTSILSAKPAICIGLITTVVFSFLGFIMHLMNFLFHCRLYQQDCQKKSNSCCCGWKCLQSRFNWGLGCKSQQNHNQSKSLTHYNKMNSEPVIFCEEVWLIRDDESASSWSVFCWNAFQRINPMIRMWFVCQADGTAYPLVPSLRMCVCVFGVGRACSGLAGKITEPRGGPRTDGSA